MPHQSSARWYAASLDFAAASPIGPPPAAATNGAAAPSSFCHPRLTACASASNVSYAAWASPVPLLAFLTSTDNGTVGDNVGQNRILCRCHCNVLGDRWGVAPINLLHDGVRRNTIERLVRSLGNARIPAFEAPRPGLSPAPSIASSQRLLPSSSDSSQMPRQCTWRSMGDAPINLLQEGYAASPNFAAVSPNGPPPAAATNGAAAPSSFCQPRLTACDSATNVSYAAWASPDAIAGLARKH